MAVLQSENLTLTPCSPQDQADFIALERDPTVMHFLNGGAVVHENVDPSQVAFLMPRGAEPHVWTGRMQSDGAFVGWFYLYPDSETRAELGYRLRADQWGWGLATEGARALVDWGFGRAGYDTISACTLAVNTGSRRVMEKLGMAHSHTDYPASLAFLPGAEQGQVWYELTRSGWAGG